MAVSKLMRTQWFPQPHREQLAFLLSAQVANKDFTILPICFYDEAQGAPKDLETNPEHTSFAVHAKSNCFINSRVNIVFTEITFSLTKAALETDKVTALKVCFMPITMSFLENYTAKDEKSTNDVQSVLEMQTESTDRQGYPLYAGTKLTEKFSGSGTAHADQLGLTTNQIIENVAFSPTIYYDSLQWYTIAGLVKASQRGLKWLVLSRQRPVVKIRIPMSPKAKRMNPYTFFGVLVGVPKADSHEQIPQKTALSAVDHVVVNFKTRFNEWNQGFYMEKV